jgi:hypothetical protein
MVCFAVSLIVSCKRSDDNLVPAFISVGEYSFQPGPLQGSSSTGLTEFWCYTDGDILGVVDTPVSLPLLKQGRQTITVFAGIKNNGMGVSRIRYPFYTSFDTTLDVVPGNTYRLNPRFSYLASANVNADRNFENGNFLTPGTSNNGQKESITVSGFPASGQGCGLFRLPAGGALLQYRDITSFSLTSGSVAFMEMDYSCNNTFSVGVYVTQGGTLIQVPVLYLTPTQNDSDVFPNWNKIYMDLGMVAKQYPNASTYLLYIECSRNEASVPVIYLDDIKIVK